MTRFQQHQTHIAIASLLAVSCAFAASASMSKAQYTVAEDRISAAYKVDKAACDSASGNAKDICIEKAKGKEKVDLATLEYSYAATTSNAHKLSIARADADFAIAKEICDDKAGNAKDMCRTEAKSAHSKALANAKLTEKIGDAKKDAAADRRDADYKLAKEKCQSMVGDAQTACLNNAKVQFNKT